MCQTCKRLVNCSKMMSLMLTSTQDWIAIYSPFANNQLLHVLVDLGNEIAV